MTVDQNGKKLGTRDRILAAARELFAEGGYASVSVRDVTSRADVSLSSINYHFGGKDELVQAVVTWSWTQVASEIYDEFLRQDKKGDEHTVTTFAYAMVYPLASRALGGEQEAKELVHLIVKGYGKRRFDEMPKDIRIAWKALGRELIRRFRLIKPDVEEEDAAHRIHFTLGVLLHSVIHLPDNHVILGIPQPDDYEDTIQQMVKYCAAGLELPGSQKS